MRWPSAQGGDGGDGGAVCAETLTYQQKVNDTWVTPAAAMFFRLWMACGESYAYVPSNDLPLCAAPNQN